MSNNSSFDLFESLIGPLFECHCDLIRDRIRGLIPGLIHDPIRDPVCDPVRNPVRDPVHDPVRDPVWSDTGFVDAAWELGCCRVTRNIDLHEKEVRKCGQTYQWMGQSCYNQNVLV